MEIFNKILHSYAMYCRKEMVKILKCYLIPKKALCLTVQFFWPTLYLTLTREEKFTVSGKICKAHNFIKPI